MAGPIFAKAGTTHRMDCSIDEAGLAISQLVSVAVRSRVGTLARSELVAVE